jgi:Icc-related predicted phosphoesterase
MFFSCDVHGSDRAFRKWITAADQYKANFLLLSGDLTGKGIIPLVRREDSYSYTYFGRKYVSKEHDLEKHLERVRASGFYPFLTTPEEIKELENDRQKVDQVFKTLIEDTLERWLKLVEEKVAKDITVIINPGNDDALFTDDIIKGHERVIYPLKKAIPLGFNYEMVSLEYTNPSPWKTQRECTEEELSTRLLQLLDQVNCSFDKLVCNFHCPPYGTALDIAPQLKKDMTYELRFGEPVRVHVGSKSIYNFILEHQPLLGLHGHIHESPANDHIKKTTVLNPGSEYQEGMLRGFVIDFTKDGLQKWFRING